MATLCDAYIHSLLFLPRAPPPSPPFPSPLPLPFPRLAVSDRPGGLAKLVTLISEQGASVVDITHERAWLHTSVDQVVNKVVVGELCVCERERDEGGRESV